MRRVNFALFLGSLVVLSTGHALAQDKVSYRDRATGKDIEQTGAIQSESPDRIIIKGTATKEIPAIDIVDVVYEVPGGVRLDYSRLGVLEKKTEALVKEEERKKGWTELLKAYQDLLPKLTGEKLRFARRHVQFKMALTLARMAEDDPGQLTIAIDALSSFKKEHMESWQITGCAKLLARLQIAKGDIDAAQKTYQDLAAIPTVSKETKQECDLLGAQALITGKKYAEAKKKLETLQKTVPASDPQAVRVRVYLAECQAASGELARAVPLLEDIIKKTADSALKAAAYNALGDSYRLNGRPKEALWAYLWVDVLYYQDKQEHAHAVVELAKLFEELGDGARASQYRERLKRDFK